jgi:hypothetical protein
VDRAEHLACTGPAVTTNIVAPGATLDEVTRPVTAIKSPI